MPKIKINGREIEAEAGKTILQVALANGIYIPHYCYHPYLSIAGNCRMCLVDIKPGPPKPSVACNTVVAEGMEIETENPKIEAARQGVMEFMLKNHPVDCPICDQAGECGLQDFYMKYDLKPSRILGPQEKVKKRKALRVGKTLVLDTERCILCSRCVRFMKEIAGDDCLTIAERRDCSEITLFPGKTMDNPYSLCLADICPVGAWTGADFRFKQRVWFLTSSPSICPECARGCNIWIDHRRGEVFRIRPRLNEKVNKCWACDEGRLSYHALNDIRLTCAAIGEPGCARRSSVDEAVLKLAEMVKAAGSNLAVVLSASLSLEEGREAAALFKDKLGARLYLHAGEPGWSDDILRSSDQNANVKGLEGLGITDRNLAGIGESAMVVLFETMCPKPLPPGVRQPAAVISPQLSLAVEKSVLSIPAASYAESAGTVVNVDGIEQKYEAALPLKGDALPHVEILKRLAKALG
jgi:NADH-quinone oxidoreductase subunit G